VVEVTPGTFAVSFEGSLSEQRFTDPWQAGDASDAEATKRWQKTVQDGLEDDLSGDDSGDDSDEEDAFQSTLNFDPTTHAINKKNPHIVAFPRSMDSGADITCPGGVTLEHSVESFEIEYHDVRTLVDSAVLVSISLFRACAPPHPTPTGRRD
jgi:hypothetical protein